MPARELATLKGNSDVKRAPLRQAQRQLTRDRLVEAAAEVFSDYGFDTSTIDDVAIRANVGRTTVYKYFTGKPQLAEAVAHRFKSALLIEFRKLGEIEPSSIEQLSDWLANFNSFSTAQAGTVALLPHTTETVAAILNDMDLVSAAILQDWAEFGWEPAIDEAQQALRLVLNLVDLRLLWHVSMGIREPEKGRAALIGIVNNELVRIVRRSQRSF